MASTTYDLKLKISAENQASGELDKVSKQTENLQKQGFQWSKTTESNLKKVGATATIVAGSMIALGKSFVDNALKIEPVERSYKQLAESVGESSDAMLKSLRTASVGAVKDYDLMLAANKSMKLGVAKNTEQLTGLMKIARLYGQQMGQDVTSSFDDIVTGLGRGSAQILDNLGIVVDSEKAYEEYAKQIGKTANELSKEEKVQALVNSTLVEGGKALEMFGEPLPTMQERIDALGNQFDTIKTTLGKALLPVIERIMEVVQPIIEKIVNWIEENPKLTATIFGVITAVAGLTAVFSGLALILPAIMSGITLLMGPVGLIIAGVTALAVARATNFGGIRDKTMEIVQHISDIIKPRLDKIKAWWDEWGGVVMEVVKGLWDFVEDVFASAFEVIGAGLEIFFEGIDVLIKVFSGDWEGAWEGICNIWETLIDTTLKIVDNLFGDALDWIADKLVSFGDWFKQKWEWLKNTITGIFTAMWEGIKTAFEFWVAVFTGDWETAGNIISGIVSGLDETLTGIFGGMWENIKGAFQAGIDWVVDKLNAFKDTVMSIVNAVKDAWEGAKNFVGDIGSGIGNAASSAWNFVSSPFRANGGPVQAGSSYIVGERGPELFVPSSNGNIVPNEEITSTNNVTINMSGITIREDADITKLAEEIVRMTKLEKNYGII